MSGENQDTNNDILEARYRSKRNQATLNIELALTGGGTSGSGGSAGSVGGGVGTSPVIPEGGGGGGSPPCFSGGTLVRMAKGNQLPIWRVTDKKRVLAPDVNGILHDARVLNRWKHRTKEMLILTFEDGEKTETRPEHKYFFNGLWIPADEIEFSRHWNGTVWIDRRVTNKRMMRKSQWMYNLEVEAYHTYLANDDWVSNAKRRDEDEF